MSKKRPHESSTQDSQLIEIFEDLSSLDENIRLTAAHTLIVKHVESRTFEDPLVERILRRLVRGLSSGRKAARVGFSVALAESLNSLIKNASHAQAVSNVSASLLQSLRDQTEVNFQSTKQEGRHHYHGQLFGITALIRSGLFFSQIDDESFAIWAKVVDFVLEIASKKSWLREECGFMLVNLIKDSVLPTDPMQYAGIIISKLSSQQWFHTPEGLAIWLVFLDLRPKVPLPKGVWHHGNPLHRKEKERLAKVLTGMSEAAVKPDESQPSSLDGRWQSSLHFAWREIVPRILTGQNDSWGSPTRSSHLLSLSAFWQTAVDGALFSPGSSQERKYKGFLVFQHFVAHIPAPAVATLFSQNITQCLQNHLAVQDRYLHRVADQARRMILKRARDDPEAALPLLQGMLLGLSGDLDFDGRTKTKTIEELLAKAALVDPEGTADFLRLGLLQRSPAKGPEIHRQQLILASAIVAVLRRTYGRTTKGEEAKVFARKALYCLGSWTYSGSSTSFSVGSQSEISTAQAFNTQLNARILSCFSHILGQRLAAWDVVYQFFHDLSAHDDSSLPGRVKSRATTHDAVILTKALDTIAELAGSTPHSNHEKGNLQQALIVLLGMIIITAFNGESEAVSLLEDLLHHLDGTMIQNQTIGNPVTFAKILLALVSRPSILFRRTVGPIFAATTHLLDWEGLQCLLEILDTDEGPEGQESIFDSQPSPDRSDLSVASDAETGKRPTNILTTKPDENTHDQSERVLSAVSDTELDTGSELSAGEDDDDELLAFDRKLAETLGACRKYPQISETDESSPDEEMDDDQMEQIDRSLQSIFREKKKVANRRQQRKGAKDLIVQFKCRVLELLETYIKLESANVMCLNVLLPLLKMIRSSSSPMVARKGCDLVKLYLRQGKGNKLPKIEDTTFTFELLGAVHEEIQIPASNHHADACSNASLLLVKVLAAFDKNTLRKVIEVYSHTQMAAMFNTAHRYKVGFFIDWLNWSQSFK